MKLIIFLFLVSIGSIKLNAMSCQRVMTKEYLLEVDTQEKFIELMISEVSSMTSKGIDSYSSSPVVIVARNLINTNYAEKNFNVGNVGRTNMMIAIVKSLYNAKQKYNSSTGHKLSYQEYLIQNLQKHEFKDQLVEDLEVQEQSLNYNRSFEKNGISFSQRLKEFDISVDEFYGKYEANWEKVKAEKANTQNYSESKKQDSTISSTNSTTATTIKLLNMKGFAFTTQSNLQPLKYKILNKTIDNSTDFYSLVSQIPSKISQQDYKDMAIGKFITYDMVVREFAFDLAQSDFITNSANNGLKNNIVTNQRVAQALEAVIKDFVQSNFVTQDPLRVEQIMKPIIFAAKTNFTTTTTGQSKASPNSNSPTNSKANNYKTFRSFNFTPHTLNSIHTIMSQVENNLNPIQTRDQLNTTMLRIVNSFELVSLNTIAFQNLKADAVFRFNVMEIASLMIENVIKNNHNFNNKNLAISEASIILLAAIEWKATLSSTHQRIIPMDANQLQTSIAHLQISELNF